MKLEDFYNEIKIGKEEEVNRDLGVFNAARQAEIARDLPIVEYFMQTKWAHQMLTTPDNDAYCNTPLHIACLLHSVSFTTALLAILTDPSERATVLN